MHWSLVPHNGNYNQPQLLKILVPGKVFYKYYKKNTIRDGCSTALYAAYIVNTFDTVDTVTVDMVYTVDMVNAVDTVYTVYTLL